MSAFIWIKQKVISFCQRDVRLINYFAENQPVVLLKADGVISGDNIAKILEYHG